MNSISKHMKLLHSLAAAAVAAVSMTMPALAKVDSGSTHLIQTLQEYGVTVLYNPSTCSQGFQGQYTTRKVMTLCYRGAPTASDHDTLRHEAFHFLQHCAAIRRGQGGISPLAINPSQRTQWVSSVLRSGQIDQIRSTYPEHHHQVELEAFAAAAHYDANDLATLITRWCVK